MAGDPVISTPDISLGIVLTTADPTRLRSILLFIAGAAATERRVAIYVTGPAIRILIQGYSSVSDPRRRIEGSSTEIPTIVELIDILIELSVAFLACPTALVLESVPENRLIHAVRTSSVTEFLRITKSARIISF